MSFNSPILLHFFNNYSLSQVVQQSSWAIVCDMLSDIAETQAYKITGGHEYLLNENIKL